MRTQAKHQSRRSVTAEPQARIRSRHARSSGLGTMAVWLSAAAGLTAATAAHAQCPPSFAPMASYLAGTGPRGLTVGDFNADGRPDMAVTNRSSNTVTVRLGTGGGAFGVSTSFNVGLAPSAIATADFNADGRLDLVTANSSGSSLTVLLGTGTGSFGVGVNYSVGSYPTDFGPVGVATGDFNGDGRVDLAAAILGNPSGAVVVLLGNGNGTFGPAANVGAGMNVFSVAVGDVNGDGRADIVAANTIFTEVVRVLLGNGNGTFAPQVDYSAGPNPRFVAIGDVSGDGRPDLVTVHDAIDAVPNDETVSVMLGTSAGTFAPAVNYPVGLSPFAATIGDVNGDAQPDIVVSNNNGANVSVLPGVGNGVFAAAKVFATGTFPLGVVVTELSGDARPDIAVANSSGSVSVLLGNGQQALISQQPVDRNLPEGQNTTFGITATGATSYQWRRNGVPLNNGGRFSGVTTATLSITGVQPADAGVYEVLIGTACNAGLLSRPAMLCVQPPPPPPPSIPNDSCSSASLISNGTRTFSTVGATTDGPPEPNLGFCCGELQVNQDVWFLYTATCTGTVTVNTCGTFFDSKIAIYNGAACPTAPGTAIAGNDDTTACGVTLRESQATFGSTAGEQYLIRVGAFAGAAGDVVLNIGCEAAPPPCAADFNQSGIVSTQDIFDFLEAYFTGCP